MDATFRRHATDRLVQQMQHLDDDALRWISLEGLINALEVNESKVDT